MPSSFKFIMRSLAYYRRIHIWTVLGIMTSTAILAGALILGDSIRHSLRQIVHSRLGQTGFAIVPAARYISTGAADKLAERTGTTVSPVLITNGMIIDGGGERTASHVRVVGFDRRFGYIGDSEAFKEEFNRGEAIINSHTAARLGLKEGDEFLMRVHNPGFIPRDVIWSLDSEINPSGWFRVKSIVSDREFGGFNLKAEQTSPQTVFIPLDALGEMTGMENTANALLIADRTLEPFSIEDVNEAFRDSWSITDAGFTLTHHHSRDFVELKSSRILIEDSVADIAKSQPSDPQGIFSYLVNEIRLNESATPYSFVSTYRGQELGDDEIIINEWLARDLETGPGDELTMNYYVLGHWRSPKEETAVFRVKSIIPMQSITWDSDLMPDIPGVVNADHCRNWDIGIPVDLDKIRDKDEKYWEDYRGTPKAFISLGAAQRIWKNPYGNLTSIRFRGQTVEEIESKLSSAIEPALLGFTLRDVKKEGLEASGQTVAFDQLFLGLSSFIVLAALLLTGLLFVFTIEQRESETGLLLALGFDKTHARKLILYEGMILAVVGSIAGVLLGIFYHQIILAALKTVWSGITGTTALHIHVRLETILMAVIAGMMINILAILFVVQRSFSKPVAGLQKGISKTEMINSKKPFNSLMLGLACLATVIAILSFSLTGAMETAAMTFFTAGGLLLAGGMAIMNYLLAWYSSGTEKAPDIYVIAMRNTARRRMRSLAVIGLFSVGIFITFTVGLNRRSATREFQSRASGTGGFALLGESAIPILHDLNTPKANEFYSLHDIEDESVRFVQFRVREGDDASCLNLNRVSNPQLIGVNPYELSARNAFTFLMTIGDTDQSNPWSVLDMEFEGGVIPGIADQTVITWGLGKAVGDTLLYQDENGREFRVVLAGGLANSIFQGNIIISEKAFTEKFPSISGSQFFLVDAPFSQTEYISGRLGWALEDYGIELTGTLEKLDSFNVIENTYLSIFLILGVLGLILGSAGIGIMVARNVSERAGELAILQSVGFSRRDIRKLLMLEHSALIISGAVLGSVSSLVASFPSFVLHGSNVPFIIMILMLIILIANGEFWAYSAAVLTTKTHFLPSLRNE